MDLKAVNKFLFNFALGQIDNEPGTQHVMAMRSEDQPGGGGEFWGASGNFSLKFIGSQKSDIGLSLNSKLTEK